MNGRKLIWIALTTGAGLALAALLLLTPSVLAQATAPLPPVGVTVSRITASTGEAWLLAACPGDRITVTMQSDAFTPFMSVFTDTDIGAAPVVEAASEDGAATQAVIEAETGGLYTIVAAGERRSDRGDYTIGANFGDAALAEVNFDGVLTAGAAVTGAVRSSAGESWVLRGCAGAMVTATVSSTAFTPYVEIFDPMAEETLAEGVRTNDQTSVAAAELPATGVYLVLVAGERRNDRGAYTLALNPAKTDDGAIASATSTPLRGAPTATPVCVVRANPNLNVRSGPGTVFAPLGTVRFNTQLRPLARNLDASWVEVQTLPTGLRGWVATGAQFISCTIDLTTLPVGVIPPTPTPAPTATPTPTLSPVVVRPPTPTLPPIVVIPGPPVTPVPTLPPLVVLPGGGGPGGGGWSGALVTGLGIGNVSNGVAVFRDRVFFRAEIDRTPNNRRIDRVEFRIQDEFGDEFYTHTERTYGYCAFGGGEPTCNVLEIRRGARWPDTNRELCNGDYTVFADIFLDNGNAATWNSPFTIAHPDLPRCGAATTARADLEAYIAQTGPGHADSTVYGALVFQVVAFDPNRGFSDGDGIRNVEMRILAPDGREVYQRTENRAAYCAFAGGEPDCNVWYFGDHGDAWPSGAPVRYGEPHRLRGRVNAEDGRTREVEMTIFIEP